MRPSSRRFQSVLVHLLIGGVLTMLIAALFVSPERLLLSAGDIFAPAPVQAQTITTDCAAQTAVPQAECEALLALYTATDGPNWRNNRGWAQDNDICRWYGVTCDNGSVTRLQLSDNELRGSISPELGNLTNLQELSLGGNQLSGSIPPELANLQVWKASTWPSTS